METKEYKALLENFLSEAATLEGPVLRNRINQLQGDFNKINDDPNRVPGDVQNYRTKIKNITRVARELRASK